LQIESTFLVVHFHPAKVVHFHPARVAHFNPARVVYYDRFLHRTNQKQFNQIEREADFFASCLLMPQERFLKDIYRQKFSIQLIDSLKDEYNVSRTACAFRFADIGNHDIMIVYGENGKIRWKHCSEHFPYKYLLYENKVAPNSVMGEYFKNNTENLFKNEEIWAVDIFNYVKEDDTHRKFFEHCITFRNEALSIIWEE
ncbi:hypothetical protein DHD32_12675, partial [Arenibacter sp. TNZ]|uniref:ImmA/IrrE family metallo-endopeptidase n=1 Tax=Arenibacter TaxID=178469 RepID=UPI0012FFFAE6